MVRRSFSDRLNIDPTYRTAEMDINKIADKLEEAGQLEGSEVGEYWCTLAAMATNAWQMSDEFKAAYTVELALAANDIDENYTVVEETIQRPTTVRHLQHNSDRS